MMTEDVKQKRKLIQQYLFQKKNMRMIDELKPLNGEDQDFVNDFLTEKEIEFFKNGSNSTIPIDQYLELFYNHFAQFCKNNNIKEDFQLYLKRKRNPENCLKILSFIEKMNRKDDIMLFLQERKKSAYDQMTQTNDQNKKMLMNCVKNNYYYLNLKLNNKYELLEKIIEKKQEVDYVKYQVKEINAMNNLLYSIYQKFFLQNPSQIPSNMNIIASNNDNNLKRKGSYEIPEQENLKKKIKRECKNNQSIVIYNDSGLACFMDNFKEIIDKYSKDFVNKLYKTFEKWIKVQYQFKIKRGSYKDSLKQEYGNLIVLVYPNQFKIIDCKKLKELEIALEDIKKKDDLSIIIEKWIKYLTI